MVRMAFTTGPLLSGERTASRTVVCLEVTPYRVNAFLEFAKLSVSCRLKRLPRTTAVIWAASSAMLLVRICRQLILLYCSYPLWLGVAVRRWKCMT